jgi:hypothetical protein
MRALVIGIGAAVLLAGCVASSRESQDKEWTAIITDTGCAEARHFPSVAGAKLAAGQQKPFLRTGCTAD